jgi:hypothetical protein
MTGLLKLPQLQSLKNDEQKIVAQLEETATQKSKLEKKLAKEHESHLAVLQKMKGDLEAVSKE